MLLSFFYYYYFFVRGQSGRDAITCSRVSEIPIRWSPCNNAYKTENYRVCYAFSLLSRKRTTSALAASHARPRVCVKKI